MSHYQIRSIIIIIFISIDIISSWPPAYSFAIETYEEFETDNDNQTDNMYDDLIEPPEIHPTKHEKYFQLHKWANKTKDYEMKRNVLKGVHTAKPQVTRKFHEYYMDSIDPVPWEAGFVDDKGNFIHPENEKVYYLNEMAKNLIKRRIEEKRAIEKKAVEETVDYKNLEQEYEAEVKKEQLSNQTLNFTEPKEEESMNDAVADILHIKPKNCTEEERSGIGLSAMKCFVNDMARNKEERPKLFHMLLRIALIWFVIYLVIAIPCFCQKGWCCCCFNLCFKFCRPHDRIEEAKSYLANNPLGVYHTEDGKKVTYEPTNYERYAQKRLDKAVMQL